MKEREEHRAKIDPAPSDARLRAQSSSRGWGVASTVEGNDAV